MKMVLKGAAKDILKWYSTFLVEYREPKQGVFEKGVLSELFSFFCCYFWVICAQIPSRGAGAITIQLTDQITQKHLIQTVSVALKLCMCFTLPEREMLNQSGNALVPVAVHFSFYPHVPVCYEQLNYWAFRDHATRWSFLHLISQSHQCGVRSY